MSNVKTLIKKLVNNGYSEDKLSMMTEKEIRDAYKIAKEEIIMKKNANTTETIDNATTNKEESTMKNNNTTATNNSTTTKIEPWEQLGLTENQYYNEPIWSWARVDYHIDNYSNREETKNACEQESMRLMNEENIASGCTEINSYSGRYLGEMLTKES